LVDQRAQQARDQRGYGVGLGLQRSHRAQQALMLSRQIARLLERTR
jgi:hypothetical protein